MAMLLPGHTDKQVLHGPWLEQYRGQHYVSIRVGNTDIRFLLNEANNLVNMVADALEEAQKRGLWKPKVSGQSR